MGRAAPRSSRPPLTSEQPALVQAVGPVGPEFDPVGDEAIAPPIGRPGDFLAFELADQLLVARLERSAAFERARLVRRPGADPGVARAAGEIGVGLGGVGRLDPAFDADLAAQATSSGRARRRADWRRAPRPCGSRCWCRRRSRARHGPSRAPCAPMAAPAHRRWRAPSPRHRSARRRAPRRTSPRTKHAGRRPWRRLTGPRARGREAGGVLLAEIDAKQRPQRARSGAPPRRSSQHPRAVGGRSAAKRLGRRREGASAFR